MQSRFYHLEQMLELLASRLTRAESRLVTAEQQLPKVWGGSGGGGGTPTYSYRIKSPGFSAATGSFPTLTPSSATVDVYQSVGGALVLYAASQTIYWYYKDASTSGRLMSVLPNADGSWDAILDSCTGV